jgi:hypothetical protein
VRLPFGRKKLVKSLISIRRILRPFSFFINYLEFLNTSINALAFKPSKATSLIVDIQAGA